MEEFTPFARKCPSCGGQMRLRRQAQIHDACLSRPSQTPWYRPQKWVGGDDTCAVCQEALADTLYTCVHGDCADYLARRRQSVRT